MAFALKLLSAARHGAAGRTALAGAAILGALALVNHAAARRAERRHPARGRFVEVDGVRLHYSDRGSGRPVVLVHGNAVTGDDFDTSGLAERLLEKHRVIIFDRPGYGHSQRPRGRMWTATQQAELLHGALTQLRVERPVVVGHSWGAIVALSLAARHPAETAGLLLLSGYYFGTLRPDVLLVAPGAIPVLGDVLRYTVSPWLGRVMMPLLKRSMFSPRPVPPRFRREYSDAMALRPSQIRASSVDGVLMIPGALANRRSYGELTMPVAIMAGAADKVVFARGARRLQACILGSVLLVVERAGHMLHHAVPERVLEMIEHIVHAATDGGSKPPLPRKGVAEVAARAA